MSTTSITTTPESTSKTITSNAFSQRQWSQPERLKVIELYSEMCAKIGPNNRIPAATDAQVDKFNKELVCILPYASI